MRIYFAHAVNIYNTPIEQAAIKLIAAEFPGDEIENPNQSHHQVGYGEYAKRQREASVTHKGMGYFYDKVLPDCGEGVAMPFLDGRMGLGVNGEMKWFVERDRPVFFMEPTFLPETRKGVLVALGTFILYPQSGLFTIREFTDKERDMVRSEDPALVVPHAETRLRTWRVYNLLPLPYEEAHLVGANVPDYFYLKDKLTTGKIG